MSEPCLPGLCCRDAVLLSEAERFGLAFDYACNPNSVMCGCPDVNALALEQWKSCGNDASLDFVLPQRLPQLAPCVPNLRARENARAYSRFRVLAATATDIGGIRSRDPNRLERWRERYGVDAKSVLLVHQESCDLEQEKLWKCLQSSQNFEELRPLGRLVFVGPGFSVYDSGSMCPLRQVLHMRLSLRMAARANRAGIPSIPTLGWNHYREQDLDFLIQWCSRQGSKLRTIAVNAQTGTVPVELRNLASGMTMIESQTGNAYQWVVFGGRVRIEQLSEFIPRGRIVQVAREKDFQTPVCSRNGELCVQYQLLSSAL